VSAKIVEHQGGNWKEVEKRILKQGKSERLVAKESGFLGLGDEGCRRKKAAVTVAPDEHLRDKVETRGTGAFVHASEKRPTANPVEAPFYKKKTKCLWDRRRPKKTGQEVGRTLPSISQGPGTTHQTNESKKKPGLEKGERIRPTRRITTWTEKKDRNEANQTLAP